jgi:hypothetical protein
MSAGPEKNGGAGSAKLDPGSSLDSFFEMNESARVVEGTNSPVSRPYFTRKSIDQAYYDVSDPALAARTRDSGCEFLGPRLV